MRVVHHHAASAFCCFWSFIFRVRFCPSGSSFDYLILFLFYFISSFSLWGSGVSGIQVLFCGGGIAGCWPCAGFHAYPVENFLVSGVLSF